MNSFKFPGHSIGHFRSRWIHSTWTDDPGSWRTPPPLQSVLFFNLKLNSWWQQISNQCNLRDKEFRLLTDSASTWSACPTTTTYSTLTSGSTRTQRYATTTSAVVGVPRNVHRSPFTKGGRFTWRSAALTIDSWYTHLLISVRMIYTGRRL